LWKKKGDHRKTAVKKNTGSKQGGRRKAKSSVRTEEEGSLRGGKGYVEEKKLMHEEKSWEKQRSSGKSYLREPGPIKKGSSNL